MGDHWHLARQARRRQGRRMLSPLDAPRRLDEVEAVRGDLLGTVKAMRTCFPKLHEESHSLVQKVLTVLQQRAYAFNNFLHVRSLHDLKHVGYTLAELTNCNDGWGWRCEWKNEFVLEQASSRLSCLKVDEKLLLIAIKCETICKVLQKVHSSLSCEGEHTRQLGQAIANLSDLQERVHGALVFERLLAAPTNITPNANPYVAQDAMMLIATHCADDELAPVEEVVKHLDEVVAVRDEELAQEMADHDWAHMVVQRTTDPTWSTVGMPDFEQVFLFRFSRTPYELINALMQGTQLASVRDLMREAGCSLTLCGKHGGAKIFVWPEQYQTVIAAVGELEMPLFTSNVIVAESLLPELEDIVASIPSKRSVRLKCCDDQPLARVACHQELQAEDSVASWEDYECFFEERRTFLCAVRVRKQTAVQSTTEAHGGMNPRRYKLDSSLDSSMHRKMRGLDS